jgi:hypothetical protein
MRCSRPTKQNFWDNANSGASRVIAVDKGNPGLIHQCAKSQRSLASVPFRPTNSHTRPYTAILKPDGQLQRISRQKPTFSKRPHSRLGKVVTFLVHANQQGNLGAFGHGHNKRLCHTGR